jgi:diacylglycerol kinase (ATP)
MVKRIHFIINPASGQPGPVLGDINQALAGQEIDWTVDVTTPRRSARSLVQPAITDDVDLIVAYGGDGTIMEVINGMAGSQIPLAILHGGTGNALAYQLNVPVNLVDAIHGLLSSWQVRPFDLGRVDCHAESEASGHFILRATIGLHNMIMKQATREMKERFGNFAYIVAGLRSLADHNEIVFDLSIDGQAHQVRGLTCIIANSAAIGGGVSAVFAPDVDPTDGQLDVFVLKDQFEPLVSLVNTSLGGDLEAFPRYWRGRQIEVRVNESATVALDGESLGPAPAKISVVAGGVNLMAPVA